MVSNSIKKIYYFIIKHEIVVITILSVFVILLFHVLGIGCPTRFLTGISCPGCGMTRAVMSALKLDFKGAMHYHPLVWTLPVIAILFIKKAKINAVLLNTILVMIIVAFMVVYLVRLLDLDNGVVYADLERSFIYKVLKIFHA